MTAIKIIAATAAIASIVGTATAKANEISNVLTMKPIEGISFDVGTKRAVSYFVSRSGRCNLVLTLAEPPSFEGDLATLIATRFEAAIPASKSTRYRTSDGKSLEFTCHADAQMLSVSGVEQIADGAVR